MATNRSYEILRSIGSDLRMDYTAVGQTTHGDIASVGGAADSEGYYRDALALAGALGMRPLVAHCQLGLGKLCQRAGKRDRAREHLATATTMYREMGMRIWLEQAAAAMK